MINNPKHIWKYVKAKTKSKEPIGDLKYTTESGDKAIAGKDDRKAEVLCDVFKCILY